MTHSTNKSDLKMQTQFLSSDDQRFSSLQPAHVQQPAVQTPDQEIIDYVPAPEKQRSLLATALLKIGKFFVDLIALPFILIRVFLEQLFIAAPHAILHFVVQLSLKLSGLVVGATVVYAIGYLGYAIYVTETYAQAFTMWGNEAAEFWAALKDFSLRI